MTLKIKSLLVGASALALTACGEGPVGDSWTQEAGAFIDEGGFGNPTMNNTLIHNGDQTFLANLNQRFTAEVPSQVTFAFDEAVLDEEAKAILREQANWIRQFPEIRFRVYGHTDAVGSDAYNLGLSEKRAEAVRTALVEFFVIPPENLETIGYGEQFLKIPTEEEELENRRVSVRRITPLLSRR